MTTIVAVMCVGVGSCITYGAYRLHKHWRQTVDIFVPESAEPLFIAGGGAAIGLWLVAVGLLILSQLIN